MSESTDENEEDSDEPEEEPQTEVVEFSEPEPAEEIDSLSTFSEQEGPFSFKVIPVIKQGSTDWRAVVYMTGVQGPVYESTEKIADEAAESLGMSRRLQRRLNEALDYADRNLQVPAELGDQTREKRSLHELEVMMDGE
jgi:hypothetical protein